MSSGKNPAPTAPQIAYQWMKDFISRLPRDEEAFLNEAAIGTETGTSRTPVREALLRLETEGFIKRVPHKGAYVPAISDAEVRGTLQARAVFEKWAAREVLHDPRGIDRLEELVAEQNAIRTQTTAFIELDTRFHTHMVDAAGNPVMASFYRQLRERQLRMGMKAITAHEGRLDDVLREHRAIVEALRSGDTERVDAAIQDHLDSTGVAIIGPPPR